MMMMNFSNGLGGFIWSLFTIIFMALPFIIAFGAVSTLAGWFKEREIMQEYTPLEHLKVRLAKGNISLEEYLNLKTHLD